MSPSINLCGLNNCAKPVWPLLAPLGTPEAPRTPVRHGPRTPNEGQPRHSWLADLKPRAATGPHTPQPTQHRQPTVPEYPADQSCRPPSPDPGPTMSTWRG
eukprot:CAMPEP_0119000350 /NCGR_PEP_ID=MMETSP1173-20130426/64035_1 /TAXON_ID=1034831 /ORGANISM="Rhizochromulina marina cf, Strain CCMP1243" /LENGTH=100 /DNA_ID=CAMNT_0006951853 /DNA_START=248 /DNA_END=551 /DNA_ORIENTATION=+